MTTEYVIELAEYIVDQSRIVDRLVTAYRTSNRGAKPPRNKIRCLLIGMFLTAHIERTMMLAVVHRTLMKLPIDTQRRLGIVHPTTLEPLISMADLYNLTRTLKDKLSWIDTPDSNIPVGAHDDRRDAVMECCDAVMDVFPTNWESSTFSIDATGLHAWGRSIPKRVTEIVDSLDLAGLDQATKRQLIMSEGSDITADMLSERKEWEARWGGKTSKAGAEERFFGYHEHTMVLSTPHTMEDGEIPPLIQRFRLTAANADVVAPTLDMIDTAPGKITDILVDRHYHYKQFDRWARQLAARHVTQHFDLRENELGFTEDHSLRWAAGVPHCPGTPDEYGELARPALGAPDAEKQTFKNNIERRQAYALSQHSRPNADGQRRVQCPALAGKVGCPLRAGTVEVAIKNNLPTVEQPPSIESHPQLPKCCTQQTVTVTPADSIRKLEQPFYWGSEEWEQSYRRRAYVEGSYGNRKNPATENVDRGQNQVFGLVWLHIAHTMINASYNVRRLVTWAAQHPKHPNAQHPLCQQPDQTADVVSVTMTTDEYRQLRDIDNAA